MRKFVAAGVLTATAVAGMGLAASAAEAATAKPVARCQVGEVKISLTKAAHEVGMNHTGFVLKATNTSHHSCTITGYASVQLENAKHRAIHTKDRHGSTYFVQDPGAHRLVVKPGTSAVADLAYSHIRQQGTEHASYVKVSLPGVKGSQTVRLTDPYVFQGTVDVTAFASHLTF